MPGEDQTRSSSPKGGSAPKEIGFFQDLSWRLEAAAFKALFVAWRKRWERAWGAKFIGIWKLEFQRRGAPHLHLYTMVPRGKAALPSGGSGDFRRWFSESWADVVAHPDPAERRRHRLAGTGIDLDAGMRSADPQRLSVYFGKHAAPNAAGSKEYQHIVPAEWAGRPGRFWGYIGLEKATATAKLSEDDFIKARRVLRRWSRSRVNRPLSGNAWIEPRTAKTVVQRGFYADGTPRYRRVTRRRQLMTRGGVEGLAGGFTMSNDGAAMAAQLARALAI